MDSGDELMYKTIKSICKATTIAKTHLKETAVNELKYILQGAKVAN